MSCNWPGRSSSGDSNTTLELPGGPWPQEDSPTGEPSEGGGWVMLSLCTCVLQEICCLECLPCPTFCLDGAWLNLTTLLPLPLPPQTPLHHGFCGTGQPASQNQSQVNCSCIPHSCWQSQVAATWAASSPCSSTATTRASFLVSQAF